MGLFSTVIPSSPLRESYSGFPPDCDNWTCAQWKQYYIINKSKLGKDKAEYYLNNDTDRIGMFSTGMKCAYDCDFINFFRSEGININSITSNLWCGTVNLAQATKNTTSVIKNTTSLVESITGNKLLLTALIAGGGYLLLRK